MEIILFILSMLLPALLSAGFFVLEKGRFGKLPNTVRQVVIGLAFGGLAVLASSMGIKGSTSINVRDVAPITAGLIFGGPAGIIAGVIGGIVRIYVTLMLNLGAFSGFASAICTVLAGIFGALIHSLVKTDRKYMLLHGIIAVAIIKIVHMMLIFLFQMSDSQQAFAVVQQRVLWMLVTNMLSMALAVTVVSRCADGRTGLKPFSKGKSPRKISNIIQSSLVVCLMIAFLLTSVFINMVETRINEREVETILTTSLYDIPNDVLYTYSSALAGYVMWVAEDIEIMRELDQETAGGYADLEDEYETIELYIVDPQGYITYSQDRVQTGKNIADNPAMSKMDDILGKPDNIWLEEYGPGYYYQSLELQYVGCSLKDGGLVIAGFDRELLKDLVQYQLIFTATSRHVGKSGIAIIFDEEGNIISSSAQLMDSEDRPVDTMEGMGFCIEDYPSDQMFETNIFGIEACCMYTSFTTMAGDYTVLVLMPMSEVLFSQQIAIFSMIFVEIMVFVVLFVLLSLQMKKLVVDNIQKVNATLTEITEGNLNVEMDVRGNKEFDTLSDDINATVDALKLLITKEAERIDQDLANAKVIQQAALPAVFPDKDEFALTASMHAAREVGGDFYDFYMLDEDRLVFLIADVSGKGIPAAMFMMTSKTVIKSQVEDGADIARAFTKANIELCENAREKMFVTAWMGVLNLKTGLLQYVNAGHNPPLIKHGDQPYEYLRTKPNFVLAGMKGMKYRLNELQLEPGDEIFLYTDGVTEALNTNKKLYGESRLLDMFRSDKLSGKSQSEMLDILRQDISDFAGEAEQADDITMLIMRYKRQKGVE